jgi:hypothetical protein
VEESHPVKVPPFGFQFWQPATRPRTNFGSCIVVWYLKIRSWTKLHSCICFSLFEHKHRLWFGRNNKLVQQGLCVEENVLNFNATMMFTGSCGTLYGRRSASCLRFLSKTTKPRSHHPLPLFIVEQIKIAMEEEPEHDFRRRPNFQKENTKNRSIEMNHRKTNSAVTRYTKPQTAPTQQYANPGINFHDRRDQKRPRQPPPSTLPPPRPDEHVVIETAQSNVVEVQHIPPMSSLDDIVRSINRVMDEELELGIVDLDGELQADGTLPMVSKSGDWVQSATFILSAHARPTAWRIEFENRSIAHAFLQRAKTIPFVLVWKPVPVIEYKPPLLQPLFEVDDSMIRVENFPDCTTIDSMRHLFRRYELIPSGPTVVPWVSEQTGFKVFIVKFADPSWARAAVRELQGVEVKDMALRLAQYPKQIIRDAIIMEEESIS